MTRGDGNTTVLELQELVRQFVTERGWDKHHTPRAIAMGIAIEAAELLEHYQWDHNGMREKQDISDELSDVLFNLLNFAYLENIDISQAFRTKYKKLQKKYPTAIFNPEHSNPADYQRVRQAYRSGKEKTA